MDGGVNAQCKAGAGVECTAASWPSDYTATELGTDATVRRHPAPSDLAARPLPAACRKGPSGAQCGCQCPLIGVRGSPLASVCGGHQLIPISMCHPCVPNSCNVSSGLRPGGRRAHWQSLRLCVGADRAQVQLAVALLQCSCVLILAALHKQPVKTVHWGERRRTARLLSSPLRHATKTTDQHQAPLTA